MIILDSIAKSLEVILNCNVNLHQLPWTASYVDITTTTFSPLASNGVTNDLTEVTMLIAPVVNTQRQLKSLTIFNQDDKAISLIIRLNDNGTYRNICSVILNIGETLSYIDTRGFNVLQPDGSIKTGSTSTLLHVLESVDDKEYYALLASENSGSLSPYTSNVTINPFSGLLKATSLLSSNQFISSGNFAIAGDARAGVYMQRNTTIGTALTSLYLDGISQSLIVTPNSVWTYEIMLTAKRIDEGLEGASIKIIGSIGRNKTPDSIFLIGNPSITMIGRSDPLWNASVIADITNGALVINVIGSLGKTIRWVAKIMTLEVSYI
jgi:hypothetical protein